MDLNHDGRLDIVQTNGVRFPTSLVAPFFRDRSKVWVQLSNGGFEEVSERIGFNDTGSGKGLLTLDYDRDGDQDVLIVQNADEPLLVRNDQEATGGWLRVRVEGTISNRGGRGAIVTVQGGGRTWTQEIGAQTHFLGESELTAHYGLGDASVDRVEVTFPVSGVTRAVFQSELRTEILVRE